MSQDLLQRGLIEVFLSCIAFRDRVVAAVAGPGDRAKCSRPLESHRVGASIRLLAGCYRLQLCEIVLEEVTS